MVSIIKCTPLCCLVKQNFHILNVSCCMMLIRENVWYFRCIILKYEPEYIVALTFNVHVLWNIIYSLVAHVGAVPYLF